MRTPEELAEAIMIAAACADGGCSHCACEVLEEAMQQLPELPWRAVWEGVALDEFGEKTGDFQYFNHLFEAGK
jgi:hypothetical protein